MHVGQNQKPASLFTNNVEASNRKDSFDATINHMTLFIHANSPGGANRPIYSLLSGSSVVRVNVQVTPWVARVGQSSRPFCQFQIFVSTILLPFSKHKSASNPWFIFI